MITGGFNQPIMCGGEPRVMRIKERGEADLPIYTIKIQAPKYGLYYSIDALCDFRVRLILILQKFGSC